MSLDDLHPTQYFGRDAVQWMHPNGKVLSLSPAQFNVAQRRLLELTDEQRNRYDLERLGNPFEEQPTGQELADLQVILDEANKLHSTGCSSARTGRCICDYLAQWDSKPVLTFAPGDQTPVTLPDWSDAEQDPDFWNINNPGIESGLHPQDPPKMCVGHDRVGWHYTHSISCQDWEKELDRIGADKKPRDPDVKEPEDWADAPVNKLSLPVVIVSGDADPAEVAEKIVKDNPQWFGELPPDTYISSKPVAQLQQALSDEKLRTKYWHGEHKDAMKRYWWMLAFAAVNGACLIAAVTQLVNR